MHCISSMFVNSHGVQLMKPQSRLTPRGRSNSPGEPWRHATAALMRGRAHDLALKPFQRVPGVLIAVVGATIALSMLALEQSAGVKVLGPLPQGLASFALPWTDLADLVQVVIGGCAVAMVARHHCARSTADRTAT